MKFSTKTMTRKGREGAGRYEYRAVIKKHCKKARRGEGKKECDEHKLA